VLGHFRSGQILGFPAGFVARGVHTDLYRFQVAFLSAGAMGLFAGGFATVVLPTVAACGRDPTKLADLPAVVRADTRILLIGLVNLVVRFAWAGVLVATLVLYAEGNGIEFGVFSEVGATGILLGINSVFVAATIVSEDLSDRVRSRASVILPAMGLAVLGFAVMNSC
jgi:hypothetical protein